MFPSTENFLIKVHCSLLQLPWIHPIFLSSLTAPHFVFPPSCCIYLHWIESNTLSAFFSLWSRNIWGYLQQCFFDYLNKSSFKKVLPSLYSLVKLFQPLEHETYGLISNTPFFWRNTMLKKDDHFKFLPQTNIFDILLQLEKRVQHHSQNLLFYILPTISSLQVCANECRLQTYIEVK